MKNLIILILMLFSLLAYPQKKVSVSIHQDAKLLIAGDGYYKPGTLNIVTRLKMQGNQDQYGYMIVFPEFEYADIDGTYKRYSANIGYTLNKLMLNNLEASVSLGWGFINRYSKSFFSGGGSGEIAYKLNDIIKVSILGQLTERKDLKAMYGSNEIRFSGFIGLEFNLN